MDSFFIPTCQKGLGEIESWEPEGGWGTTFNPIPKELQSTKSKIHVRAVLNGAFIAVNVYNRHKTTFVGNNESILHDSYLAKRSVM